MELESKPQRRGIIPILNKVLFFQPWWEGPIEENRWFPLCYAEAGPGPFKGGDQLSPGARDVADPT